MTNPKWELAMNNVYCPTIISKFIFFQLYMYTTTSSSSLSRANAEGGQEA